MSQADGMQQQHAEEGEQGRHASPGQEQPVRLRPQEALCIISDDRGFQVMRQQMALPTLTDCPPHGLLC
jgi:hypothetical protein